MNNPQDFAYKHDGPRLHQYQRAVLARLPQITSEVEHFDDLLQWLGEALVQYFHIQVIQFWVGHQRPPAGQLYLELRMMVFQNPFLSQEVVVNAHVARAIERIFTEHRGIMPQPIDTFFPQDQAELLNFHHLGYWSCYFMNHNALLPPAKSQGSRHQIPLSMTVAFFFQEKPHPRLIPVVSSILEQTVIAAKQHQLLKPSTF